MAQRPNPKRPVDEPIQSEKLEPIAVVQRELTRPDGTRVVVAVPVYPPFRLAEGATPRKPARARSAPSLKRRRGVKPRSGESS